VTLPVSTVSSPGCARPNPSGGYRYGFEPGPPPRRRGSPVTAVSGVLGPLGSEMSPGRIVPTGTHRAHRDAPCPPGRTVPTGTHQAPPGRTRPHRDAPGPTGTHRAPTGTPPCPSRQHARHRGFGGLSREPARRRAGSVLVGPYLILTSEGGDQIGCRPAAVEQGANVPTGAPQRLEGRDALQGLTARDVENDRIPRGGGD
jgi:hypothetical protein